MSQFSINQEGTDMWLTSIEPAPEPPVASALDAESWKTIWHTEDEQEAEENCPPGFVVGPRPPRPH